MHFSELISELTILVSDFLDGLFFYVNFMLKSFSLFFFSSVSLVFLLLHDMFKEN